MKRLCYWPKMFDDVLSHFRKCVICRCAKSSNENVTTSIGNFRDPKSIGRMISIDLMGEYPLSKFGNRYIFVVVDCFSKYIWTKTMRSQTAKNVINFLENTVFAMNGCPQTINSDNGKKRIPLSPLIKISKSHCEHICQCALHTISFLTYINISCTYIFHAQSHTTLYGSLKHAYEYARYPRS